MHLAPGVHDVELTFQRGDREITIHPAAVETPAGLILVDVGLDAEVLRDGLAAHEFAIADVATVILTHQDGDHVAALSALLDETDATVMAHLEAVPYIDGSQPPVKGDRGYDPVGIDVELTDGVRFRTDAGPMEVVFTPGHSPGHISLYLEEQDLLLAADAVTAQEGTLGRPNEQFTPNMARALDSVGTLAKFDTERVLCYHGGGVLADSDDLRRIAEGA
jgi:glyoxylase-like metal-dependent hydrolase (beta-lactamase superfamily II)